MTTTEQPAATKRSRPKDRREQILRQAFTLISTSGFNAVSLADIAKASGIQKSSVLHHFPSMNDLLLAVLNLREEEDAVFYLQSADDATEPSPASARLQMTRVFEHNLERPGFSRLYSVLNAESLAPEHPAHQYFADRERNSRAEMARLLAWKPQPELAAAEFLSFWSGLEMSSHHDPDLDVMAVWNTFCDRFFA